MEGELVVVVDVLVVEVDVVEVDVVAVRSCGPTLVKIIKKTRVLI